MRLILPLALVLGLLGQTSVQAEPAAPALGPGHLAPERVYADPDLSGETARGVKLSPDGSLVTFLKAKASDQTALDLWAAPTEGSAPPHLLIDSSALEPKGVELSEAEKSRRERQRISSHGVVDYDWDDQGKVILAPAGGEIYLADVATGAVARRIAKPATGSDATDAKVSPKGGYLSFVRDGAVFFAPLRAGPESQITPSASASVSYGVAEFVAQEEMGRDTGYWWRPDDGAIAYARVDESGVDSVPRFDIGAHGATIVAQAYPRAGRPNAKVALFIHSLSGGKDVAVDLGANSDIYLARVDWAADGSLLYVQRESRDQRTLDLLAVDPKTGAAKVILTEHQSPWINLNSDFRALKTGEFLWASERTGFNHLYLYGKDGTLIRAVTSGPFPLVSHERNGAIVGLDEQKGLVYVLASPATPIERHLFVADYRHGGALKPITSGHGWWSIAMSKAANAFVGGYSDPATPPQTALYGIDGARRRFIVENKLDASHPYFPFAATRPEPEFGTLTAEDGQTLHYVLIKPVGFDPKKSYPALIEVYGGPGVQLVTRAWRSPGERLFSEAGYVLFQLDNRGSFNRGLAFEAPIFGKLGEAEVHDQIVGLRYVQSLPYVDPKRVGVTGWSYGGYMTLRLLTEPGAGFAAGAAGGPPSDWRLYDTHYTERYMGDPNVSADAYDRAGLMPRLKDLKGRLLLMHGMADDNVVFENSTRIMAELQSQAITFDLMLYPGQRHGVHGQTLRLQQMRTWLEFFQRTLGGPQDR